MKLRMFVTAMSVVLVASVALGCPGDKDKTAAKAPYGAKTAVAKAPCGTSATTVAATTDGRSETVSPCSKSATLTAAKAGCGKDCTKPCCKKSATTVSAKSPCGNDCTKPCCAKNAATVSAKAPCGKSAALTASAKAPCGGCPIAAKAKAILTSMPAMKYRVGEEVTGCSMSAAAMAEKAGKKVQFVVGDDILDTEGEAIVKLTALLEKEIAAMQTVRYVADGKCGGCPMTAKSIASKSGSKVTYRVGGVDFTKKEDAEKVVKLVADAVTEVRMAYKVDGKTFQCDKAAGAKCKETGAKLTYVIGDQETGCKTDAALKLAEAKVRKIVETAAAASFSL